jgi:hypothetical protein
MGWYCSNCGSAGVGSKYCPCPPKRPSEVFKADAGKRPMHLLPVDPINDIVDVLAFGAKKYSADAWRDGIAWNRVLDAAERHLGKFKKGEDFDDESGLSHIAHAACNLVFILEYTRNNRGLDDRFSTKKAKATSNRTLHDVLEGPCMCGAWHTNIK